MGRLRSAAPTSGSAAAPRGTGWERRCACSPTISRSKTLYGHGRDWPIPYSEMEPLYALAEKEIGVAARCRRPDLYEGSVSARL